MLAAYICIGSPCTSLPPYALSAPSIYLVCRISPLLFFTSPECALHSGLQIYLPKMGFKLALKNQNNQEFIRWKDDTGLYYVARAMTFESLAARLPVSNEAYLKLLDEAAYRNINSRYFFVAESVLNAAVPPESLEIHSDQYSFNITDSSNINDLFSAFQKGLSLTVQAFNRTATSPYGRYENSQYDSKRYFVFNNQNALSVSRTYLEGLPQGKVLTPWDLSTAAPPGGHIPGVYGLNQHYTVETVSSAGGDLSAPRLATPSAGTIKNAQTTLFNNQSAFTTGISERKIRFTATIETLQVLTDLPRTETQKTIMNGKSAATASHDLWPPPPSTSSPACEWMHLSAFAPATTDATQITDLILGTVETNAQMLLFETQIQNMLMIWGGTMVADISVSATCLQADNTNNNVVYASWLASSIQYDVRFRKAAADDRAVKMGMTDLDVDEVDASYDPFHFTITFNPFLTATPTVVEQYVIQGLLLHHQTQYQHMQPVRADNTLLVTADGPVLQLQRILPRGNKRIERQLEQVSVNLLGHTNQLAVQETQGQTQFTTVHFEGPDPFSNFFPILPNAEHLIFQNTSITAVDKQGKSFMVFVGDLFRPSGYQELSSLFDILGVDDPMRLNVVMYLKDGDNEIKSFPISTPGYIDMSGPACFTKNLMAGGNILLLSNLGLKINCLKNLDYTYPNNPRITWRTEPYISGIMELYCLNSPLPVRLNTTIKSSPNGLIWVFGSASGVKNLFGLKRLCFDYLSAEFSYTGDPAPDLTALYTPFTKSFEFTGKITHKTTNNVIQYVTWLTSPYNSLSLQDLDDIYNNLAGAHLNIPDWDIQFENATISLATDDFQAGSTQLKQGLWISATVTVNGYSATVNGKYGPDGLHFEGDVTQLPKNLLLGEDMTVGSLKLIIDLNRENSGFQFKGVLSCRGIDTDCLITLEKDSNHNWNETLCADLHGPAFALSSLFPQNPPSSAGYVLDNLRFTDAVILVSNNYNTQTYNHNGIPYVFPGGALFMGVLEELPALSSLLHKRMTGLYLKGNLNQINPDGYNMEILLPEGAALQLGERLPCGPLSLSAYVYPNPKIQLRFTRTVINVPGQVNQIPFNTHLLLGMTDAFEEEQEYDAGISEIDDLGGIPGLNAHDISGDLKINYAAFAVSGRPDKNTVSLVTPLNNTSRPQFKWNVSDNPQQDILYSKITDNTFGDYNTNPVRPVSPAYVRSLIENFVPGLTLAGNPVFLNLEQMELYGSPEGGSLGDHPLQPGMSFSATLILGDSPGMEMWAYFNNQSSDEEGAPPVGLVGSGQTAGFNLGPLAFAGPQGKEATVNLVVSAAQQDLRINGSIRFQGYLCDADVVISNNSETFDLRYLVNDICFIDIHGNNITNNEGAMDFELSADLNEDFLEFLSSLVVAKLNAGFMLLHDEDTLTNMTEDLAIAQNQLNINLHAAKTGLLQAQAAATTLLHTTQTALYTRLNILKNKINLFEGQKLLAKAAFKAACATAQGTVTSAQNAFNSAIRAAEANLNSITKTNLRSIKSDEQNFLVAQNKWNAYYTDVNATVTALQGKINDLNSGIILLQTKRNEGPHYKQPFYDAEISGLQAEISVLQGLFNTATYNLDHAQDDPNCIYNDYQLMQSRLIDALNESNSDIQAARTALDEIKHNGTDYHALQTAIADLVSVQTGADYNAWKATEAAGETARKRGQAQLEQARYALNHLSQSVEFQTLRAVRAAFEVMKTGPAAQSFAALQAGVLMADLTAEARDAFAGALEAAGTQAFFFKSAQLSGSFRDVQSWYAGAFQDGPQEGAPFTVNFTYSLLGADYSFGAEVFDLNDLNGFVQRVYSIVLQSRH
jgi:hypothetical protein